MATLRDWIKSLNKKTSVNRGASLRDEAIRVATSGTRTYGSKTASRDATTIKKNKPRAGKGVLYGSINKTSSSTGSGDKTSWQPYSQTPKKRYGSKVMSKSGADLSRHGVSRSGKVPGQYMNVKAKHLKSGTSGGSNPYGTSRIDATSTRPAPRTSVRSTGFMDAVHRQRKIRGTR